MLDIRHFGKKGKIMAKKLTPEQIFEKLEELHDQENELLERLKEQVCKCDDEDDDDLDADFDDFDDEK